MVRGIIALRVFGAGKGTCGAYAGSHEEGAATVSAVPPRVVSEEL